MKNEFSPNFHYQIIGCKVCDGDIFIIVIVYQNIQTFITWWVG